MNSINRCADGGNPIDPMKINIDTRDNLPKVSEHVNGNYD
jgi:hypothetical protein